MKSPSSESVSRYHTQGPDLTVVTLTLNESERLAATVASVDLQEGCSIEHLIVNGGSPVPLPNPTNPLVARQVIDAPPLGIYDAMNRGLAVASGKGIMFLHSGDRLFRPDSAVAASSLLRESDWGYGGLVIICQGRARVRRQVPYSGAAMGLGLTYTPHPSAIMSTIFLRNLGGFDPTFGVAADQMVLLRAGQVTKPSRTRRLLAIHHQDGASADRDPDVVEAEYRLMRRSLQSPVLGSTAMDDIVARAGTAGRKFRRGLRAIRKAQRSPGVSSD